MSVRGKAHSGHTVQYTLLSLLSCHGNTAVSDSSVTICQNNLNYFNAFVLKIPAHNVYGHMRLQLMINFIRD